MKTSDLRKFADDLEYNKAYDKSKLRDDVRDRIHNRLVGSDDSSPIGIPPTPMWETGDSYRAVRFDHTGWYTMSYYRSIERLMGTEIYELTDSELDYIAELIVDHFDNI